MITDILLINLATSYLINLLAFNNSLTQLNFYFASGDTEPVLEIDTLKSILYTDREYYNNEMLFTKYHSKNRLPYS